MAKRVNLSHATVSFVLNRRMDISIPETTRHRVLLAAKEMGYRPNRAARALVSGRTNMVALWLPMVRSAYYARVQLELAMLVASDGFDLVTRLFDFSRTSDDSVWDVDDWPVDGILTVDCYLPSKTQFAAPSGTPLVSAGARYDPNYDHVGVDIATGLHEAIAKLATKGCRRVAFLTSHLHARNDPMVAAYFAECKAQDIEPELMTAGVNSLDGVRATLFAHFEAFGAPDGIIAHTEELALACRQVLSDRSIDELPNVLIVGYDGSDEYEFVSPPLMSISLPTSEMCRRSWALLMQRILAARADLPPTTREKQADDAVHGEVLPTRLIVFQASV
ncbi:MAG: LacI family DNA-binding transcriptional regulator [Fimbriimonadaceae bacterium]